VLVTHEPDIAKHAWRRVNLRDGMVLSDVPTEQGGGPAAAAATAEASAIDSATVPPAAATTDAGAR
jgi:hypothetical protein